jgi:hypothetical protein
MLRHIVLIKFNPDATDDQITSWRADFTDWAAFRHYIDSPAHQDYVRDHAAKVVGSLAAIQHEI